MPNRIKAKFRVDSVKLSVGRGEVSLQVAGGPGNEDWQYYTPVGTVTMTVTEGPALDAFVAGIGRDVAVEFSIDATA